MKRITNFLLLIVLILSVSVSVFAEDFKADGGVYEKLMGITFDDMAYKPVNHWSGPAVYTVAAAGLIKGDSGNFIPEGTVTRSEALAVLFRSSGSDDVATSYFNNVKKAKNEAPENYNNIDSWADGYIRLAVDYGILTTDEYLYCMSDDYNSDGAFQKNMPALKSELAEWIVRVYGLELKTGTEKISRFYDYESLKAEDKPYLETAVYYGILNGSGDRLDPYVTMTREQMAQIFYNIRKLWAQKLEYEIASTTVKDVVKNTTQAEGLLVNDFKIVTDWGNLTTKKEYKLNGEAIDNTVTQGLAYEDFVVIAEGHLPTDCTILKKSDGIDIYLKNGKVEFILLNKESKETDFSSGEYKDVAVYQGSLYYVDTDEKTVVIQSEGGFKEISYTKGTEFSYRTNSIDHSKINEQYRDKSVYVFTCASIGDKTEYAYRVQIVD